MDLKEVLRKKIEEDVLKREDESWCIFVYDSVAALVLSHLFTISALMSYNIVYAYHIDEERSEEDFPVIYFVSCSEKVSKRINSEVQSKKYTSATVKSLIEPDGLDRTIPFKVVSLNVECLEERVFKCDISQLSTLEYIFDLQLDLKYLPTSKECAEKVKEVLKDRRSASKKHADLIIIDRSTDMYTPIAHFFTFRTALGEVDPEHFEIPSYNDSVWKAIKYKHIAEVSDTLKFYVSKLNKNMEVLKKKKLDTDALSKMVLDAPKNIETKEAIEKYASKLSTAFKRLEYLKELVEAEQLLMTGHDAQGKKAKRDMEYFFDILRSQKIPLIDRLRLLYIIKIKNISLTKAEIVTLKVSGFQETDLNVKVDTKNHIREERYTNPVFTISRYTPIIYTLVKKHISGETIFQGNASKDAHKSPEERVTSLRRSSMITQKKDKPKKCFFVYMTGGISLEEFRVVESLSEEFGVEVFIGSDKIINYNDYISSLKSTK